jgi:hypothetical protein
MKNKTKTTVLLACALFAMTCVVFNSCQTSDEPTVVVPKTLDQYKAEFGQFVDSQIVAATTCVVGYNKGNFKVTSQSKFSQYQSAYLTVLNSAKAVLAKTDLKISDIVQANTSLTTAGKNFTGSLWISDRRPLNDSITVCNTLNTATLAGTSTGQVPQDAKTTFTAAIATAVATRDAATTIDRQVKDGVTALSAAKTAFKSAIIK